MSLVRVRWSETREYEAEVEVPGFDFENGEPGDLRDAVLDLGDKELELAKFDDVDVDIHAHEIIRVGEG